LLLGIVLIEHMTARLTAKWFPHNDKVFLRLKSSVITDFPNMNGTG